jgi:hypothetical protein
MTPRRWRRSSAPRARWAEKTLPPVQLRAVQAIQELELQGATVLPLALDVADEAATCALFARLEAELPQVRGVVHAAGVWEPTMLAQLNADSFTRTLSPKVAGAWGLHRATAALELDFFVLFSSCASVWGGKALGHYAAANQFLDSLASLRRAQGKPGLSVNWGLWDQGGMVPPEQKAAMVSQGLRPMGTDDALGVLGELVATGETQQVVAAMEVRSFSESYAANATRRPLLTELTAEATAPPVPAPLSAPTARRAEPAPQKLSAEGVLPELQKAIAQILRYPPSRDLNTGVPLTRLGLDSITAAEIQVFALKKFGAELQIVYFLQGPTVAEVAAKIASARS